MELGGPMNFMPATTAMSRYKGNDSVDRIEILAFDVETLAGFDGAD